MYNKLFTKIVDSSIWMEADHVRLVWLMFIAIMDEDGYVNLASEKNVAHRAVMDLEKASNAIHVLESPDPDSSNPANEGRRITRVSGGWIVNNAGEYRGIIKREHQKELNRERVRKHRSRNAGVTSCNATVTHANDSVTPSEADTESETKKTPTKKRVPKTQSVPVAEFDEFWKAYPRKVARGAAEKAWKTATKLISAQTIIDAAKRFSSVAGKGEKTFLKHPATWLNDQCWLDELPEPAEKVCRWPYDDTDIHTPEGMALLTKTFLENQHRA